MKTLAIDIETYSSVDLIKSGVYAYTEAHDFEILLFAYAFDDEPVQIVDLAQGETLPQDVMAALQDNNVIKTAFNANFERTCIAKHFNTPMPPNQWRCTAVHALTLGYPNYLDGVAKSLNVTNQKDSAGKALIRFFSIPCKPTKANGKRTRNLPEHDMDKWRAFKDYCIQDVEVERDIRNKLVNFEIPEQEQRLWELDQEIVDRGILADPQLIENAIQCDTDFQTKRKQRAKELTGLDNPNSVAQLKDWLREADGIEVESLSKDVIPEIIKSTNNETVKEVLRLRQEMSKTSVKKYQAMERGICKDNRVRGLLQFYGANRTGRWAGRLVQVQNLPKNELRDLDLARNLLLAGEYELLELLFDKVPDVLSQLIRTAFVAPKDSRFIVSDFSAIEARVIAWLAGEKWRIDVFKTHGKIYEASAAQMFNVPVESIKKGDPLRDKGKIAELALGYGGAVGALKSMGALRMGLEEEELPGLVKTWRKANPNITKFWWDTERAAHRAVEEQTTVELHHGIVFSFESNILFLRLPSGRRLAYVRPRLDLDTRFNKPQLTYEGSDPNTGRWGRVGTYGPKLVENLVQAVARDCLAVSMIRLDEAGYKAVMHVHDEVVLETPNKEGSLDEVERIMGQPIEWAKGLPLEADGFETVYYKKD